MVIGEVKGTFTGDPTLAANGARFAMLVAAHYEGVEGVRYRARTTVTRVDGSRAVVPDVLWGVGRAVD